MPGETRAKDAATQSASIEQRLRALEDERDIGKLIMRYAQRLDLRDHKGYAALFARNGRWSGRMGDATGPDAIEAMLIEGLGPTPDDFRNTQNFHLMSNLLIKIDGDTAKAESRLTYFARKDGKPVAMLAGRYEDELVREDGHWRFKYRRVIGEIPTREEQPVQTAEERGEG
jgi:3-phenylpropionate/cinnamic acid dioxygenase small subunit